MLTCIYIHCRFIVFLHLFTCSRSRSSPKDDRVFELDRLLLVATLFSFIHPIYIPVCIFALITMHTRNIK